MIQTVIKVLYCGTIVLSPFRNIILTITQGLMRITIYLHKSVDDWIHCWRQLGKDSCKQIGMTLIGYFDQEKWLVTTDRGSCPRDWSPARRGRRCWRGRPRRMVTRRDSTPASGQQRSTPASAQSAQKICNCIIPGKEFRIFSLVLKSFTWSLRVPASAIPSSSFFFCVVCLSVFCSKLCFLNTNFYEARIFW